MKVILASLLLFGVAWADLTCECGKRNAGRIVGGKETKKNEYPWMVALQTITNAFTNCGGTIVTKWHVITAAHCVIDEQASNLVLVVGAHNVHDFSERNAQRLRVDQIVMHPYYDNYTDIADMALLVTSTEIVFNEYVGPACMPRRGMGDEMIGQMVKATGWGRYDPDHPNIDAIKNLREVDLQIVSVAACDGANRKKMCTQALNKGTCKGDSGGPVVWLDPDTNRFTLVGVVSTGPKECGTSYSANTSVSYYKAWIEMRINFTKSEARTCHKV